jgi:hypothetical protein
MASYLDGRIDLEHYRGRTCYPFAVQAGEVWVRRELHLDGIDQVRPVSWDGGNLRFRVADDRVVTVRPWAAEDETARFLTCAEVALVRPPIYGFEWG